MRNITGYFISLWVMRAEQWPYIQVKLRGMFSVKTKFHSCNEMTNLRVNEACVWRHLFKIRLNHTWWNLVLEMCGTCYCINCSLLLITFALRSSHSILSFLHSIQWSRFRCLFTLKLLSRGMFIFVIHVNNSTVNTKHLKTSVWSQVGSLVCYE